MTVYPLGMIGPWEIVIIALIILLLFGGKKIPELMKGLGKGVKNFKQGMNEVEGELNDIKSDIEKPAEKPAEKKD
ncbi:MAG: twin-arginine translocase TatA/TatE family subunit [Bacteroidales bacterium]|nr:twin-arginine translocase TatA/TatE family subunit [Bacteroidales bacterium]MBR6245967.1 twin-arginine translocase TatA/TatE family subunit [Bacteroidales bacterium]